MFLPSWPLPSPAELATTLSKNGSLPKQRTLLAPIKLGPLDFLSQVFSGWTAIRSPTKFAFADCDL